MHADDRAVRANTYTTYVDNTQVGPCYRPCAGDVYLHVDQAVLPIGLKGCKVGVDAMQISWDGTPGRGRTPFELGTRICNDRPPESARAGRAITIGGTRHEMSMERHGPRGSGFRVGVSEIGVSPELGPAFLLAPCCRRRATADLNELVRALHGFVALFVLAELFLFAVSG
eukprot:8841719-Pyramimonas_sp.AAC.1